MSENILVDFKADIEVLVYNENDWWGVSYKSSLYMEVDEMLSPFKFIFIYLLNGSNVSVIRMSFKMDEEEEEKAYQEFYSFIDRLKLESS